MGRFSTVPLIVCGSQGVGYASFSSPLTDGTIWCPCAATTGSATSSCSCSQPAPDRKRPDESKRDISISNTHGLYFQSESPKGSDINALSTSIRYRVKS